MTDVVNESNIAMPPMALRSLIGPSDKVAFQNPTGEAIFPWASDISYETVVDFGCGCGRQARQLLQQRSSRPREYIGFDVHLPHIEWCREHLTPLAPEYRFEHFDIENPFNPGRGKPRVSAFPAPDGFASLLIGWSIFNHIEEQWIEHYLSEVRRVLRPDGAAVLTWFVYDDLALPWMPDSLHALYINPRDPSSAVIFARNWLRDVIGKAGLKVTEICDPLSKGSQCAIVVRPSESDFPVVVLPRGAFQQNQLSHRDAECEQDRDESTPDAGTAGERSPIQNAAPGTWAIGYIRAPSNDSQFSVDDQLGAITQYCERRGWNLVEIIKDTADSANGPRSLTEIEEHLAAANATILIVVSSEFVGEGIGALLSRARDNGWGLAVTNESLDTTTTFGRQLVEEILNGDALGVGPAPPCSYPIPPAALIYRVSGLLNREEFDNSSHRHLEALRKSLETSGRDFPEFARILDFGCGSGRLLRRLAMLAPNSKLTGADIDAPAMEWVTAHLPNVHALTIEQLPPMPIDDNTADLVIAFSVFTHLDERYQDAWLAELSRVLAPGGYGLITVHGERVWNRDSTVALAGLPAKERLETARNEHGIAFWAEDGWDIHFPSYYHTTYHTTDYIRDHWSRWFEVVKVAPGSIRLDHDVVVVRAHASS